MEIDEFSRIVNTKPKTPEHSDLLLNQILHDPVEKPEKVTKDPEVKVHHDDPHSYGTGFNDEGEFDSNPREEFELK